MQKLEPFLCTEAQLEMQLRVTRKSWKLFLSLTDVQTPFLAYAVFGLSRESACMIIYYKFVSTVSSKPFAGILPDLRMWGCPGQR